MKRTLPTRKIVLWTSACFFCVAPGHASDDAQTVKGLVDQILKGQSTSGQYAAATSKPGPPQSTAPTPERCPEPTAVDLFEHQIAFERTEEGGTLNGLSVIHANVWERGTTAAFDVREPLPEYATKVRMVYLFDKDGLGDGGGCPAEQDWVECVEKFAGGGAAESVVRTCTTTIDIRAIPAWAPSPDDLVKRRLTDQLRSEIESKWRGVQEIVIRDFNLSDPQITMYLKMPDGESFHGCALHALREPHCDGWHLFGQTPLSSLRKWVFDRPYRLK